MASNFHTHCYFCHGKGRPEEYIEQAMKKGFSALGFSCHAPVSFVTDWNMSYDSAEEYVRTIDALKSQYQNKIQIYTGMEMDYLRGDARGIFRKYALDYVIGSVHFVNDASGTEYIAIDSSPETFENSLVKYFDSDIRKITVEYYHTVLEMLREHRIDILGHLDLVKKNNQGQRFFKETDPWYRDLLKGIAEEISKSGVIVEVNSGGIARGYIDEPYPSEWIIRELKKWDIPVMLSSDAHHPQHIDFNFDEARKMIQSAGYNEIWELNHGKWVSKTL